VGEVLLAASDEAWNAARSSPGAGVVEDGGLTQVEPGTETVVAVPPARRTDRPAWLRELERMA
jgi:peptidyl-tRNA hydrolase